MTRSRSSHPTDAELAVLRVLWHRGPSTVREVHEHLDPPGRTGYTTVLKTMQIMHEKRLVDRDESQRAHRYRARLSEEAAQRSLLGDLTDRLFEGSSAKLVMQALSSKPSTPEELEEIRQILDEMIGEDT